MVKSPEKAVFFDPQRKRWKRLRFTVDAVGVALTLLLIFFVITVLRGTSIPTIVLAPQHKNYRALQEKEVRHSKRRGTHRKTTLAPSQVVLNSGEGIRGAFYVMWDAASFSSMRDLMPSDQGSAPRMPVRNFVSRRKSIPILPATSPRCIR